MATRAMRRVTLSHSQDIASDRPVLVVGEAVFHGQHQQAIGTAVVVEAGGRRAAAASPPAAAVAALTSRRIVFKLASGRIESVLSACVPAEPPTHPPPAHKKRRRAEDW